MLEQLPIDTDSVSNIGSTGLFAYLAWQLAKFLAHVTRFLDRVEVHLEAQKDQAKDEAAAWGRVASHLEREEAHQTRVEALLERPPARALGTVPNSASQ